MQFLAIPYPFKMTSQNDRAKVLIVATIFAVLLALAPYVASAACSPINCPGSRSGNTWTTVCAGAPGRTVNISKIGITTGTSGSEPVPELTLTSSIGPVVSFTSNVTLHMPFRVPSGATAIWFQQYFNDIQGPLGQSVFATITNIPTGAVASVSMTACLE